MPFGCRGRRGRARSSNRFCPAPLGHVRQLDAREVVAQPCRRAGRRVRRRADDRRRRLRGPPRRRHRLVGRAAVPAAGHRQGDAGRGSGVRVRPPRRATWRNPRRSSTTPRRTPSRRAWPRADGFGRLAPEGVSGRREVPHDPSPLAGAAGAALSRSTAWTRCRALSGSDGPRSCRRRPRHRRRRHRPRTRRLRCSPRTQARSRSRRAPPSSRRYSGRRAREDAAAADGVRRTPAARSAVPLGEVRSGRGGRARPSRHRDSARGPSRSRPAARARCPTHRLVGRVEPLEPASATTWSIERDCSMVSERPLIGARPRRIIAPAMVTDGIDPAMISSTPPPMIAAPPTSTSPPSAH